jgi:hypothetical protein
MRLRSPCGAALALALLLPATTLAQDASPEPTLPLPRAVEAAYAAGTRSADGNPGPAYWQNRSVHDIALTVLPPDRTVRATETITYANAGPRALRAVPVRLYQNAHRSTAMREKVYPKAFLTNGITIDSFKVNGIEVPFRPDGTVSGETIKVIPLPESIPAGGQATFEIAWRFDLARHAAKEGVVDPTTFFLAYFFPRIAPIRDDEHGDLGGRYPGFDLQEFTYRAGREVDNDFADFDVSVTAPRDFLVWATGELQNPQEVLQPEAAKRYAHSLTSDQTITIATPADVAAGTITARGDTLTWRWQARDVTDFALGISNHYVWDASSVIGDPATGARVGVQAAYPETAAAVYRTMAQDQRDIIGYASTEWPGIAWPYPRSTVFVGGADEEYPMMANDSADPPIRGLSARFVAAHELYHQYFPFLMGINEQRYPILDEGWTTFFEVLFNAQDLPPGVEDGIYAAVRSATLSLPWSGSQIPAITPADSLRGPAADQNAYGKASMAYLALKDLLGDDGFKAGLQAFIQRWQGRHPLPWDMFNTFEDVSGRDLTWFWEDTFYSDAYVDLAITAVTATDEGWTADVRNAGGFPIPSTLVATYADGTIESVPLGTGTWKDGDRVSLSLQDGRAPTRIDLVTGPFVDATPADDTWNGPNAALPSPSPAEQAEG